MMASADKRHLFLSSVENHTIEVNGSIVKNVHSEKLSEMQFDNQLKFDFYIEKLCKNVNRKLHGLARVTPYIDLSKKRILMNTFFGSQFNNYCPLISMFYSKKLYHISNRLHEKGLRIIYNDKTSSYRELLSKGGSVSMHDKNLQNLVIVVYEVVNTLCPEIVNLVFHFQIRLTVI